MLKVDQAKTCKKQLFYRSRLCFYTGVKTCPQIYVRRAEGRMSEIRHILEVIAAMLRNPREQESAWGAGRKDGSTPNKWYENWGRSTEDPKDASSHVWRAYYSLDCRQRQRKSARGGQEVKRAKV